MVLFNDDHSFADGQQLSLGRHRQSADCGAPMAAVAKRESKSGLIMVDFFRTM
jgi:hypothetical protein